MLLYISTIFLLGFFAIIDNLISNTQYSKFRTFFYGIAYLLVALQFGLRDKMATDWDMYESFFKYYFIKPKTFKITIIVKMGVITKIANLLNQVNFPSRPFCVKASSYFLNPHTLTT